jgi:hypothetical protein
MIAQQLTGMQQVFASESSPYDSGYDHGCDDAGRSESDKYINQPERGPSFHTQEFMNGYYAGLNACSSGGSSSGGGFEQSRPTDGQFQSGKGSGGWTNVCNTLQPVLLQSCRELVSPSGTFTNEGQRAYDCISNGIILATGGSVLQLPLPVIREALKALSTPTGCDGIVDWDSIDQVTNLGGILSFFG